MIKYGTCPQILKRLPEKNGSTLFASEMKTTNKYQNLPSWLINVLGLFIPFMKEIYEMRYQYDRDYYFDSSKI